MVSLRKPHVDAIEYFSDDHNRKLADRKYAGGKRVELNREYNDPTNLWWKMPLRVYT